MNANPRGGGPRRRTRHTLRMRIGIPSLSCNMSPGQTFLTRAHFACDKAWSPTGIWKGEEERRTWDRGFGPLGIVSAGKRVKHDQFTFGPNPRNLFRGTAASESWAHNFVKLPGYSEGRPSMAWRTIGPSGQAKGIIKVRPPPGGPMATTYFMSSIARDVFSLSSYQPP